VHRCLLCRGDNLYRESSTSECHKCPNAMTRIATFLGLLAACVLPIIGFSVALWHPAGQQYAIVRRAHRTINWLMSVAKYVGFQAKLKIIFSFYGIATVLDATYDAKMPPAYTQWVEDAFSWAQVDWSSFVLPADCTILARASGFQSWLLVKGSAPLLIFTISAAISAATKCAKLGWDLKHLYTGALQAMPLILFLSYCMVPSVSMTIFQSWLCKAYQVTHVPP
jgi:hypothetical protein